MNSIAFAVIVLVVLGLAGGIILVLASKFMAVYEDPRIAQITECLAGANCGGCGYILTMLLMSSVREILGNGTWMGITIIPESIDRMSLMNQAPGGFFVFGCLMALCVYIEKKLNKPIERKTCGDVMLEEIDKAKTEEGGAKE